jgi:hypothetical protein
MRFACAVFQNHDPLLYALAAMWAINHGRLRVRTHLGCMPLAVCRKVRLPNEPKTAIVVRGEFSTIGRFACGALALVAHGSPRSFLSVWHHVARLALAPCIELALMRLTQWGVVPFTLLTHGAPDHAWGHNVIVQFVRESDHLVGLGRVTFERVGDPGSSHTHLLECVVGLVELFAERVALSLDLDICLGAYCAHRLTLTLRPHATHANVATPSSSDTNLTPHAQHVLTIPPSPEYGSTVSILT